MCFFLVSVSQLIWNELNIKIEHRVDLDPTLVNKLSKGGKMGRENTLVWKDGCWVEMGLLKSCI